MSVVATSSSSYRNEAAQYCCGKHIKYLNRAECTDYLEALAEAVKKAHRRSYPLPKNLAIFRTFHSCWRREADCGSSLLFRLHGGDGGVAHFECSRQTQETLVKWVAFSETDLCAHVRPHPTLSRPSAAAEKIYVEARGTWHFTAVWHRQQHEKKRVELVGSYDFSEILEKLVCVGGVCRKTMVWHRIALFEAQRLEEAFETNQPLSDCHVLLEISEERRVRVEMVRLMCYARPDKHAVLYSPQWSFDSLPTAGLSFSTRPMPVPELQTRSKVPHWALHLNHLATRLGCTEKDYSLSAVLSGRRLISYNATCSYRVAQLTELFTTWAALKHAGGGPSCFEDALHDPRCTEMLLQQHAPALLQALKRCYSDTPHLPTLHQLATHSSGLPALPETLEKLEAHPESLAYKLYRHCFPHEEPAQDVLASSIGELESRVASHGAIVHHSALGHAVLATACLGGNQASVVLKEHCRSLGMTNTTLVSAEHTSAQFAASHGLVSCTDDLGSFLCELWKSSTSVEGVSTHAHLARMMHPEVVIGGGHDKYFHAMCLGGYEYVRLNFARLLGKQGKEKRVHLGVCYKFAAVEEPEQRSNSLLVWVPGLHLGVAFCSKFSTEALFSQFTKREVHEVCCARSGDGGGGEKRHHLKTFLKHLVTAVAQDAFSVNEGGVVDVTSCVDHRLDIQFSPTPRVLRGHLRHVHATAALPYSPEETSVHAAMLKSDLIVKSVLNRRLVPMFPALEIGLQEVHASCCSVPSSSSASIVGPSGTLLIEKKELEEAAWRKISVQVSPVTLLNKGRVNEELLVEFDYVVRHEKIEVERGLLWDERNGCFRVVEKEYRRNGYCATEALKIVVLCQQKQGGEKECVVLVRYRGRLYTSETHVKEMIRMYIDHLERQSIEQQRTRKLQQTAEFEPWSLESGGGAAGGKEKTATSTTVTSTTTTTTEFLLLSSDAVAALVGAAAVAPKQEQPKTIGTSIVGPLIVGGVAGAAVGGLAGYGVARATYPRTVVYTNTYPWPYPYPAPGYYPRPGYAYV